MHNDRLFHRAGNEGVVVIRTLVVTGSSGQAEHLTRILQSDPALMVIGRASDGMEALAARQALAPDLIVMQIDLPYLDGNEVSRHIMETGAVPIILIGPGWRIRSEETAIRALAAGAVQVIEEPPAIDHPDHARLAAKLVQAAKLMAEVKVVTRRTRSHSPTQPLQIRPHAMTRAKLLIFAASTGGPLALKTILSRLPAAFPLPILVVQHITRGFLPGLVRWMQSSIALPVQIASHGQRALPGYVYFAPDDYHLGIDAKLTLRLSRDEPENNLRPSANVLFRSANAALGSKVIAVLLTGMGNDGAAELKWLRDAGAITIAQNQASSAVFGMPGEAVKLDAARYILTPEEIAAKLIELAPANSTS